MHDNNKIIDEQHYCASARLSDQAEFINQAAIETNPPVTLVCRWFAPLVLKSFQSESMWGWKGLNSSLLPPVLIVSWFLCHKLSKGSLFVIV